MAERASVLAAGLAGPGLAAPPARRGGGEPRGDATLPAADPPFQIDNSGAVPRARRHGPAALGGTVRRA